MTTCEQCDTCKANADKGPSPHYVFIGTMKVGKSTLYDRLTASACAEIAIPGIAVSIPRGRLKGREGFALDTPGIHSLFSTNEDERASRDILEVCPDGRPIPKARAVTPDNGPSATR